MCAPLEFNFLMPTGTYFALLVVPVVFGLLVIWRLVETVAHQQWG